MDRDEEDQLIASVDVAVVLDIAGDMVTVMREGLSNVARHAYTSSMTVDIKIERVQPDLEQCCGPGDGEGRASGDAESFWGNLVVKIVCHDDGVGVNLSVMCHSGAASIAEQARRYGDSFVAGSRACSDGERRGAYFT